MYRPTVQDYLAAPGTGKAIYRYATEATLVYADKLGTIHEQPLSDIQEAGILIDEYGDDMTLVGVIVSGGLR